MALTAELYYADLAALRAFGTFPFFGYEFDKLARTIADAMVAWGPTVVLQGTSTGMAGVGAINTLTTKITITPNPPLVISEFDAVGLRGPLGLSLGKVIGTAIPLTITKSGQYTGGVLGVGVGFDVSKVTVANEALLYTTLLTMLQPAGPAASRMAEGLARGIAALLLTAVGVGSVVGSLSIVSASGSSTSVMV